MSFTKAFEKKIRAVRIRCGLNLLLGRAGAVLALGGAVAAVAILVQRLFAVTVLVPWTLWTFWTIAGACILIPWVLKRPSRMQASLLLDDRLRLNERFSTTLALAHCDDPFAQAARSESLRAVQQADLRGHFPIGLSRSWYYGAGVWLIAMALVFFMPQKDLFGFLKKQRTEEQKTRQLQQAKTDVEQTIQSVRAAVERLGDPALADELKKLDEIAQAGEPAEIKRQAIKALGDLSDRIKQMQGSAQIDAANMTQEMLKRLRGSVDPFSQKVRTALAKGDYAQAANVLSQLQKQLADGTVPEESRKELARQLQELGKELQKLASQKRELEDEMKKLGLDKKLAQLSAPQLKQALQKQGLKPEMIDQLMKKMAACQGASSRCSGLGEALAAAAGGGLSGDELSAAMEQLDALETLNQQAIRLQAGLYELSQCMGCLGEGMCEGPGRIGQYRKGLSQKYSSGSGGPGHGFGPVLSDEEGKTGTKTTRLSKESGEGPVIASWYFKDIQVKGQVRRDFTDVVQAGRAVAAEAISDNEIPRKYAETVKEYFSQLETKGPQP